MDLVLIRLLFVALLAGVCYFLHPFGLTGQVSAGAGAAAACAVIVFELRVRALSRTHPTLEDVFLELTGRELRS